MARMRTLHRLGTTVVLALAVTVATAGCVLVPYDGGPRAYGDHDRYEHHGDAHHDEGWRWDGRRG